MEFQDWLKRVMAEKGWQDVELCARFAELGYAVNQQTVRSWLVRGSHPRALLVPGLCEIFEAHPRDMFPMPKRPARAA